jgi:hypothetical protein
MAKIIFHQDGEQKKILTEDMKGEESFAGSMPNAEDEQDVEDITTAEHEVGLYTNEDTEHPKEAGLAEEVEKGEKKWQED